MIHSEDANENYWHTEYGSVLEFGFLNFNRFKSKPILVDVSFVAVLSLTTLVLSIISAAILHSDDLDLYVECGQRFLVLACSLLIICNFAAKRTEFFEIIGMLKNGLSNYNHMQKAKDLHGKRIRDERSMQRKYNATFFAIFIMTISSPIFDEITGGLRENRSGIHYNFPVPIWSPIDLNSSWFLYCLVYSIIALVMATLCGNVVCFQHVVIFICNRIAVELELLIHCVDNLEKRVADSRLKAKSRDAAYAQCIAGNVKHYDHILRTYKRIRGFLNYTLVGPLCAGSLIVALGAICAVSMDNGSRVGPKIINLVVSVYGLFYFYHIQSYFELIQNMNDKVRHAFYGIQWYEMPPTVGRTVLFTLTATNQPLEFRCVKVFLVDSRIIGKIVQSAFSFMNLMIAMKEESK